jgi:squalene-hopene/tetraprenyl-beta-curcumene cyclase
VRHPYTGAPPGAWAWTDLPGGVPDADDTAGALLALHNLGFYDDRTLCAARAGVQWLMDLQNRDGGMPTFCRGWGNLPFDRSGADLTAHAVAAVAKWMEHLPQPQARAAAAFLKRSLDYLAASQRIDGSWLPLWFGNQHAPDDENPTYGTARVVAALWHVPARDARLSMQSMQAKAITWLLTHQNPDGGWGGGSNTESTIEETALAVDALAGGGIDPTSPSMKSAVWRGVAWLIAQTHAGRHFPPSPIGLYFAKLWYFEKLYPLIFTAGALTRAGKDELATDGHR